MPPAIIAAGITAVGAIGGGVLASSGASSAAHAQQQSNAQAIGEQQREYNQTRTDFSPFLKAGTGALGSLGDLVGLNGNDKASAAIAALKGSPEYTSLYNNGLETLLQNASATGGLRGGNTQDALARFGSDTLSQVYGNQLSRLGAIAGLGEGATGAVSQLGQNSANSISSLFQANGNAQAQSALTQAGIWSGIINKLTPIATGLLPSNAAAAQGGGRGF